MEGSKAAAAGWRDSDLMLCASRVVTFPMERGRVARVLRCPACGSTIRCPACQQCFFLLCPSCSQGLRYDLGTSAASYAPPPARGGTSAR
jgi:hypothetical protein